MNKTLYKTRPFLLTVIIILADQLSKSFIANTWPLENGIGGIFIRDVFNNGLLNIIHVRNNAIAFSLGHTLPDTLRLVLFIALPLLVLGVLCVYYFKTEDLSRLQRWAFTGIIGGGIGNIIDRVFRPDGVVDFISVKWFGLTFPNGKPVPLLNYERWPTFNIADSSVVVCGIILFLTIFFSTTIPLNLGESEKPQETADE
ncbi:lipoprotein signal peptidase [Spirochaetia bacterium]|nr:lipoprotein signal peptidase [Spirochaetia bacterium]